MHHAHLSSHLSTVRTALLGCGLVASLALPSALSAISLPHTFVNGTVADADAVNANFTALADAIATSRRITFVKAYYNGQGQAGSPGLWSTRVLNTLEGDHAEMGITLSAGAFTLPPGRYLVEWHDSAHRPQDYQTRLFNVTDGTVHAVGPSVHGTATFASTPVSSGMTVVDVSTATTFRIEQWRQSGANQDDRANSGGIDLYSQVKIQAL
jgi:hypothetical protein